MSFTICSCPLIRVQIYAARRNAWQSDHLRQPQRPIIWNSLLRWQLCGLGHYTMRGRIIVLSQEEFDRRFP